MLPPFAVLLPAAGRSSRFGGKEKKPFCNIDGRAVWLRTAELFVTRPEVKQCIIVVSSDDMELFKRRYAANVMFLNIRVVEGGKERFDSVGNALKQLAEEIEFVAVHDAVRPCTPTALVDAVFHAAVQYGAAMPGLAVPDTLKRVGKDMFIEATVPRHALYQAQTPQAFRKEWLLAAYAGAPEVKIDVTDDAQLVEAAGHPVKVIPGSPYNIKITTHEDLSMAELFAKHRKSDTTTKPLRPFEDERFS